MDIYDTLPFILGVCLGIWAYHYGNESEPLLHLGSNLSQTEMRQMQYPGCLKSIVAEC